MVVDTSDPGNSEHLKQKDQQFGPARVITNSRKARQEELPKRQMRWERKKERKETGRGEDEGQSEEKNS